jgi:hypothetical protein
MPTNEPMDPTVAEAERRAERAKVSLLSRVEQLKHKLTDARHRLDVPSQIAEHPLPAIGIAFALGIAAGLGRGGAAAPPSEGRTLRGAAFTALAAFGLRMVREIALAQLGQVARAWWAEHGGMPAEHGDGRAADLEPFLEH